MARDPRGRWARWYESVVEDKISYSDREFRAFATVVALGASRNGEFRDRPALEHLLGPLSDQIDVLIEKRDLRRTGGKRLVIVGWPTYQAGKPDLTAAERMRRKRAADRLKREAQAAEEPSTSSPGALDELSPSLGFEHDRYGVTGVTRARPRISSPLGSDSPTDSDRSNGREEHDVARERFARLTLLVEELTGRSRGLGAMEGWLGEKALALVEDFGEDRAFASMRKVAKLLDHPDGRALYYSASNDLRRPISPAQADRAAESEAAERRSAAARARTAAMIREQEEWIADSGSTNGTGKAYDAPSRVVLRPTPQVRGSR